MIEKSFNFKKINNPIENMFFFKICYFKDDIFFKRLA